MSWLGTRRARTAPVEASAAGAERSLVWLRLGLVLAVLLPAAFFAGAARLGYLEAEKSAALRLHEIARAAADHAARVLERNDVVMQQMLRLLKDDDDEALRKREGPLYEVATTILLRLPHIGSISVKDAQGQILMSTLLPPASRIAAGPDWNLLSERMNDEILLTVVRKRELASGVPGGSIELGLNRTHFDEFYRRLAEGHAGVRVALLNRQGSLVSSWPPLPLSGAAETPFMAIHEVGDGRYQVAVAQDAGAALAGWREQMRVLFAIMLPITLGLVALCGLALRRTRREIEARRRLRQEAESRSRAEDALRRAQRLDALGQLAGGLAHDFNNLLMLVSANAELLGRMVPQAAERSELASILRAVDGGGKLTRRLLGFSRNEPRRPEVLRLQVALEEMLDLLRTTAGNAIEIALRVDADTPPVEVDKAELEMALINLASNARDALGHKGRIRIHARRSRGGAVISVSDTGQGMSAEIMKRAFEPFFTTKPKGVGTGLGLAQVYAFCEQAGGEVDVASKLRVGTTVSMRLPATGKALPAAHAAGGTPAMLSARVLLVEDSAELAATLAASLERLGCRVTAVANALEAERAALGAQRFDVVLSDVVMPGGDGIALAQRLRKRSPDLPVVLISGFSESRYAVPKDLELLAKPCAAEEIVGALSRAIAAGRPASPMH